MLSIILSRVQRCTERFIASQRLYGEGDKRATAMQKASGTTSYDCKRGIETDTTKLYHAGLM